MIENEKEKRLFINRLGVKLCQIRSQEGKQKGADHKKYIRKNSDDTIVSYGTTSDDNTASKFN